MRPAESFINQPIRSLQEMLRVIALSDSRLPDTIPDGIYGNSTIAAVNRFQQLYGLPITGISDQVTWDKIVDVFEIARVNAEPAEPIEILIGRNEIFKPGDTGPYIYFLQTMLFHLNNTYPSVGAPEITGIYDNTTAESIQNFQKLGDLPANGLTDKRTWNQLVHHFTLLMNTENAAIR